MSPAWEDFDETQRWEDGKRKRATGGYVTGDLPLVGGDGCVMRYEITPNTDAFAKALRAKDRMVDRLMSDKLARDVLLEWKADADG